jgi:hypothetical protein
MNRKYKLGLTATVMMVFSTSIGVGVFIKGNSMMHNTGNAIAYPIIA